MGLLAQMVNTMVRPFRWTKGRGCYTGIIFPNGMGWRALLIVGVQCKQWDPGIVFSPIDFKFFGKQEVWEMDSPLNKVMLIRVVQWQAWWFLSEIFMESQRLKVGSSVATSKNHTESRFFNNHV